MKEEDKLDKKINTNVNKPICGGDVRIVRIIILPFREMA